MGTRQAPIVDLFSARDHPHAYGDKYVQLFTKICAVGSSPRVWGQDICINMSDKSFRIIPTRMGTSPAVKPSASD